MKNLILGATSAALVALMATSAPAQSAKFAAGWDVDNRTVQATDTHDSDPTCSIDGAADTGNSPCVTAELEMATLHIGSKKSILIGVSSKIGIHMITVAKGGKTGGSSRAKAEGSVGVLLTLVNDNGGTCQMIAPTDTITLKAEMRELTVSATTTADDVDVEVGIETDSTGAHHFEFVGVECDQGTYTLTADFNLSALADASGYDANSDVKVTLGERLITMQEVRAVKGSIVSDAGDPLP
jgi:hypothetical protein